MLNTELEKLNYPGELTLEALSVLDTYTKSCCNKAITARKLHKNYQAVFQYLRRPYVREFFKLKLLQAGVTPDRLAERISSGIDANDMAFFQGSLVAADIPDWSARHKFVELAAKIMDMLPDEKHENNSQVNVVNVVHEYRNEPRVVLPVRQEGQQDKQS